MTPYLALSRHRYRAKNACQPVMRDLSHTRFKLESDTFGPQDVTGGRLDWTHPIPAITQ